MATTTVYFRTDIQAILVAVAVQTVATAAADGYPNAEYVRGALDAIRATALAHRCTWPDVFGDIRANVAPGHRAILDAATAELPGARPALLGEQ